MQLRWALSGPIAMMGFGICLRYVTKSIHMSCWHQVCIACDKCSQCKVTAAQEKHRQSAYSNTCCWQLQKTGSQLWVLHVCSDVRRHFSSHSKEAPLQRVVTSWMHIEAYQCCAKLADHYLSDAELLAKTAGNSADPALKTCLCVCCG